MIFVNTPRNVIEKCLRESEWDTEAVIPKLLSCELVKQQEKIEKKSPTRTQQPKQSKQPKQSQQLQQPQQEYKNQSKKVESKNVNVIPEEQKLFSWPSSTQPLIIPKQTTSQPQPQRKPHSPPKNVLPSIQPPKKEVKSLVQIPSKPTEIQRPLNLPLTEPLIPLKREEMSLEKTDETFETIDSIIHLSASPTRVDIGEKIIVSYKLKEIDISVNHWIGMYKCDHEAKKYLTYQYISLKGIEDGSDIEGELEFKAPNDYGEYEFRYFHNSYESLGQSNKVFVGMYIFISKIGKVQK